MYLLTYSYILSRPRVGVEKVHDTLETFQWKGETRRWRRRYFDPVIIKDGGSDPLYYVYFGSQVRTVFAFSLSYSPFCLISFPLVLVRLSPSLSHSSVPHLHSG